jgi:site-specific DNA recombinase
MKAALYARVSTERQAERGTIGSQLALLREHITAAGGELVGEYVDDGHSGARLDRPGLDALRDAAEAGLIERVWCLSPDRLARAYAYQVLVLDELARFGVTVTFTDAPDLAGDDPQAVLLTQVQGVIAEYEKAKINERYRRGKLFRARAGEVVAWKTSYGYRRIPRSAATGHAHLEIYEPEATVVRRIFTDRAAGITIREICRRLNTDRVPSPTGKPLWKHSTICRMLRNEAYVGRVYYNRSDSVPDRRPGKHSRQVPRPREEWIPIDCPRIISDELFQAASRVATDNSKWSPRRAEPGQWLLKGLVKCGVCGVGTNCHKMRGRNGTWHRYYYCRNHDPLRAGGEQHRCPERNIRADALDAFVFDQIRAALTQPDRLLAGEKAVAVTIPVPDDELLAAELARLDRKVTAAEAERRRLVDIYQAGLIELPELQRRASEVAVRQRELQNKRSSLATERADLARDNQLRRRVHDFAARIRVVINRLDDVQKQQLLRLIIEDVRVTGWQVQIRLRIALDPPPRPPKPSMPTDRTPPSRTRPRAVSTEDGLRSVGDADVGVVQQPVDGRGGQGLGHDLVEPGRVKVAGHGQRTLLVAGVDQAVEPFGGVLADGQHADVVDDDEVHAGQPPDGFVD